MIKVNTDNFIYSACETIENFLASNDLVQQLGFQAAFVALNESLEQNDDNFQKIFTLMQDFFFTNDDIVKAEIKLIITMYLNDIRRNYFEPTTLVLLRDAKKNIPLMNSREDVEKQYSEVVKYNMFNLNYISLIDGTILTNENVSKYIE